MKLAIIITTYQRPDGNTPHLLKRTLESVLNQTYQNFKIFLIGDKYEDQEEFLSFKNLIPSDKLYIENLPNAIEREKYNHPSWELWWSGGVNAMNYGIDLALKEDFIHVGFLDHDDVWEPNHLELINKVLNISNPSLIFTQAWFNNSKFPSLGSYQEHNLQIKPNVYYELTQEIKAYPSIPNECSFLKSSTFIDFSQVKLRFRDRLAEIGIGGPADADLWVRIRDLVINQQIQPSIFINDLTVISGGEGYSRTHS
jgi:glycosyltransferase involved in cell wall biosynthesis